MSESRTFRLLLGLAAVVLLAVLAFVLAGGGHHRGMMGPGGGPMMEPGGQMHDEAAPEQAALEPSGTVQDGVRVVQVKARRFQFEPSTIAVRAGERVRLEVTSQDVTHGINIPDLDINVTLPPGEPQTVTFTAAEPGTHHFRCSVYCGPGHMQMHGEIVVLQ